MRNTGAAPKRMFKCFADCSQILATLRMLSRVWVDSPNHGTTWIAEHNVVNCDLINTLTLPNASRRLQAVMAAHTATCRSPRATVAPQDVYLAALPVVVKLHREHKTQFCHSVAWLNIIHCEFALHAASQSSGNGALPSGTFPISP